MILKKILNLIFVLATITMVSQNNVCESSSKLNTIFDLNKIEKCFEDKKELDSSSKPTRNRYIRAKKNLRIHKIKENLSPSSLKNENEATKKP